MRNFMNGISKGLAFIMAVAMVLTSVPSTVLASEISAVEESSDILSSTSGEISKAANDGVVSETLNTVTEDSYIDSDTVSEKASGVTFKEGGDDLDPDTTYNDIAFGFLAGTTPHAKFVTVNGGTPAAVVNATMKSDPETQIASGATLMSSEDGYEFYVVPEVGYDLPEAPVTFAGKYTYTPDGGTAQTKTFTANDLEILPLDETGVTNSGLSIVDNKTAADGSYNWDQAKKVVVKANSEFLQGLAKAKAAESGYTLVDDLIFTPATATAHQFVLPVYVEEGTTTKTYTKLTGQADLRVTYNGGIVNDDLSGYASDWSVYDEANATVALLKSDLSAIDDSISFTERNYTQWSGGDDAATENYFYYDNTTSGLTKYHIMNITNFGAKTGYINNLKSGDVLAIIIPKATAVTKHTVTLDESNNSSNVTFTIAATDASIAGSSTKVKIYKAASDGVSSAVATGGTVVTYDDYVYFKIGDAAAKKATPKKSGGADAANLGETEYWETDAITADTLIYAKTKENVTINDAKYSATPAGDKITVTPTLTTGTLDTTAATDGDFEFTVAPVVGNKVGQITVKTYNAAGSAVESTRLLGEGLGTYTLSGVNRKTVIDIDSEALGSLTTVKSHADTTLGLTIKDVITGATIDETGDQYAELGKTYQFKVEESAGTQLKANGVTATVGGEAATVSYDSTNKIYSIANVNDVVIIKAEGEACLDIAKVKNPYATLTVNGSTLADDDSVKVSAENKITLGVTALKGAEITGVYLATAGTIASATDMTTALGLSGTPKAWEVTKVGSTYPISEIDVKTFKTAYDKGFIYVTTSLDAKLNTDFTAKIKNAKGEDVTSGLVLYAGGNSIDGTLVNTEEALTPEFTLTSGTATEKANFAAATISYSLPLYDAYNEEYAAKGSSDIKYIASYTPTSGASSTITTRDTYQGSKTDASTSDTFTVSKSVETGSYPHSTAYKVEMPLTVLPLRGFYDKVEMQLATPATNPDKSIRANSADTATFSIKGFKGETDTSGTALVKAAPSATNIVANTNLKWKASPTPGTAAANATYLFNSKASDEAETANNVAITVPKKVQDITVTGTVTFADGTEASTADTVKVVENNYGYFAIPVVTVSGTDSFNANTDVVLETAGMVNSATVEYTVYHALTTTGAGFVANSSTLDNASKVTAAINANDIEPVAASSVTWTGLGSTATTDYADYINITGSNGSYTVSPKAKHTAITLDLTATVGGYKVAVTPATITAAVVKEVAKRKVDITLKDTGASTGFEKPKFKEGFAWTTDYHVTEYPADDDRLVLTNVPRGTTLTLPGADEFTGIDPMRSIYGWSDGASTYYKVGDTVTVNADKTLVALWAPKFSNVPATGTKDDATKRGITGAGRILAINGNTEGKFGSTTSLALNATIPVYVGYYPLDLKVAPSAVGACYAEKTSEVDPIEIVKTGITVEAPTAEEAIALGAPAGSTSKVIPNATLKGASKTNPSQPIDVTVTYTVATDMEVTAAIDDISVVDATTWNVEIPEFTVEATVTKSDITTKVYKNESTTPTNLNDGSIVASSVEIEVADKTVAEASVTPATNTITVTGIKAGQSTTATLKFRDVDGTPVSKTFTINVTKAKVNIIAKVLPTLPNSDPAIEQETIAPGATAWLYTGGNTVALSATDDEGAPIATGISWETSKKDGEDTSAAETDTGARNAALSLSNATTNSVGVTASNLGTSELVVKATMDGKIYERTIPVSTYGMVRMAGPDTSHTLYTTKKDNECFTVYTSNAKTTKVANDKYSYIKVKYDAASSKANKYTVTDIASYTADWIDDAEIAQTFLGWCSSNAKCNQTSVAVAVEAGKNVTFNATGAASYHHFYACFGATPITVSSLPEMIELSDELVDSTGEATDKAYTNWAKFDLRVEPATSTATLGISATEIGILDLGAVGDTTSTSSGCGKADNKWYKLELTGVPTPPFVTVTGQWNGATSLHLKAGSGTGSTAYDRYDSFAIGKFAGAVGTANLVVTTVADGKTVGTIPVYLNGEYTDSTDPTIKHYMYRGEMQKSKMFVVNGKNHYYDKDGKKVEDGPFYIEAEKKYVLLVSGDQVTKAGLATAKDGKKYLVEEDGYLFTAGIKAVDKVDRLFREDGSLVSYADEDVKDGKIAVDGIIYKIDKDTNAAERDEIRKIEKITWTKGFDGKFKKGDPAPTLEYEIEYTSSNDEFKTKQTDKKSVVATSTDDYSATSKAEKVTFKAEADVSGYSTDKEGKVPATTDFANAKTEKTYNFPKGGSQSGSEQGGTTPTEPTQPENKTAWNLFYKGFNMTIDLPTGAEPDKAAANAKWKTYYNVDASGNVTLKNDASLAAADAKKAANSSNSLLVIPVYEGSTLIGDYEYSLPVFYQKPNLKLTSTKGTFSTQGESSQTFTTTVTEKKSNGAYEPVEITDDDISWVVTGSNPKPTGFATTSNTGEIEITTSGKTSGKIQVQGKDSWREALALSYSVSQVTKPVITTSAASVMFNIKDTDSSTAKEVNVFLNGKAAESEDAIEVIKPNNWANSNLDVEGIDDSGKLNDSKLTFSVGSGKTPAKGSYNLKLKKGNTTFTLKVSVSNATLDKAVSFKVQTKMDVTTHQKMIIIPTLKGIGGAIDSSISLDDASAAIFTAEYNADLNQIVVAPVSDDWSKVSAQNYETTFGLNVGGVECPVKLKFKPNQTKPTIKIDKIKLPKKQIQTPESDGSKIAKANGEANILSTYKYNGKVFTIKPEKVEFYEGSTKLVLDTDETDWYVATKANLLVQYDETNDKIKVKSLVNANGKAGNVKVVVTYPNGATKNATLSVGVDSKN